MEEKRFNPGADVWVIEREEDGCATEVTGFVFLAEVRGMAIVSPTINGSSDIDDIMGHLAEDTAMGLTSSVYVYPMSDCYKTLTEAEAALK